MHTYIIIYPAPVVGRVFESVEPLQRTVALYRRVLHVGITNYYTLASPTRWRLRYNCNSWIMYEYAARRHLKQTLGRFFSFFYSSYHYHRRVETRSLASDSGWQAAASDGPRKTLPPTSCTFQQTRFLPNPTTTVVCSGGATDRKSKPRVRK